MTPLFTNRARLLSSVSTTAITGCGIPGSNYAEFQGAQVIPTPVEIGDADHG